MKKFNEYKGLNLPALMRGVCPNGKDIRRFCSLKVLLQRTACRVFTT